MEVAMPAASAATHTNAFIVLIYVVCVLPCVRPLLQNPGLLSTVLEIFLNIFLPPVSKAVFAPEAGVFCPGRRTATVRNTRKSSYLSDFRAIVMDFGRKMSPERQEAGRIQEP